MRSISLETCARPTRPVPPRAPFRRVPPADQITSKVLSDADAALNAWTTDYLADFPAQLLGANLSSQQRQTHCKDSLRTLVPIPFLYFYSARGKHLKSVVRMCFNVVGTLMPISGSESL